MGTLVSMIEFMDSGLGVTRKIYEKLNTIETEFNRNFNNVIETRNREIDFLQNCFFSDSSHFPGEIRKYYEEALPEQKKIFQARLAELKDQRSQMGRELEKVKADKKENYTQLRKTNTDLDKYEEKLKKKINTLDDEIARYNATIDELNTGFGIITNFFRMKKIEKEKNELIEKRAELMVSIENVRKKWIDMEKNLDTKDEAIQKDWSDIQTEYSIISEKIETLTSSAEKLIEKSSFTEALKRLQGDEKFIIKDMDVKKPSQCKKCGNKNTGNFFYCNFCGEPFSEDRKDIAGSLVETGELNRVFSTLQEGIKGAVSIIALIKGLRDGMKTFKESLAKVKKTEDQYSQLPTLNINVPKASEEFFAELENLEKFIDVEKSSTHPMDFANEMKEKTDKFLTDKNIEKYFTAMGDELNKRTKEQW